MSTPSARGYEPALWRLILDGEADGATNMAVDEAILLSVVEGASPPTLRFYAWSPPCLSLGRNQPFEDVDLEACRAAGVDVVRRPTGGRAILHTDELTYSVALRQTDPWVAGDVPESYRRLSEGLLAGLRLLGAPVEQQPVEGRDGAPTASPAHRPRETPPSAVCFEAPSDYEIVAGGRKLVGSAQWRGRGGVLQHGALPLRGDITRIVDCLAFAPGERQSQRRALRERACTLEEVLGHPVAFARVARILAQGFAHALNVSLVPGEFQAHELEWAAELRASRYAAEEWTRGS